MIELLNMDCMEYMAGCEDNAFDLAIVDPPYGIGADIAHEKLSGKKGHTPNSGYYKTYKKTNWDSSTPSDDYFIELCRVSKEQIVWGGNYFKFYANTGVIVWYKGGSGNYKEGELAKTSINTFKVYRYSRADAYINDCPDKIHPTQKPVKLYEWLLTNYAKPTDRILDTHLGSGSSAIAAHYFGCDFVGMEIDKDYYDAACQRFDKETRQVAMF